MDQKTFRQTLRRAFWIPFGIAIILAASLILDVRFLMDRAAWVEHTDQVITLSQRIYRNRVDQETGLRAYVLTGDARFLEPFYEGRKQELATEPELRKLVADNPEQTAKNEASFQVFRAWTSWAGEAIAKTQTGNPEDASDVKFQLRGKELMDQYRRVRTEFLEREQQLRDERLARSRRTVQFVNASIVALAILFALGFAILGRKQLTSLSQSFTEALNSARERRDWLHTTVTSIGDAVISTDADGLIMLMNPVAEKLTGWTLQKAQGKPLAEVFRIVNQETREAVENPVDKVRRLNQVVGLANHTILISNSGQDIAIDDSGAPIYGPDGAMTGVVLVFRDVTEQREAQRAAARLAAIVEFSGDAILTKSLDGILQTWNAGAERLFGYKADEIIGKSVGVLIPPDRLQEEDEILQRLRQGQPSERFETVRVAKDGRHVHVSVSASPIKDAEGCIIGASKVIHDITELEATRKALLREKELLATTLKSIGDAVIVTDAEGRVTFLNAEAERLTAWKASDATGCLLPEVLRIIHEQTRKPVENPVEKVLRHGVVVGLANHTLLLAKDGREIAIDDSAAPIRHSDGPLLGVVLVFRDVTEQRAQDAALRASEERLRLAHQAAHMGTWEWNVSTGAVAWSDEVCMLHGIKPGTFDGRYESWLQTIHPEDRELAQAAVQSTLQGGGEYAMDYRTLLPDGGVLWTAAHGRLLRDDSGKPQRLVGVCLDITSRKQAEETLRTDLAALTRMHALSSKRLGAEGLQPLLEEVMEVAVAILGANKGTLQLVERNGLRIVAQHRHEGRFLEFFSAAENVASVCGEATRRGERVGVQDVEESALFAGTPSLLVLRQAGVRAVQSTPLVTRTGRLLGILTTHWGVPHVPNEDDLRRLDLLVRQAADLIESVQAEEAQRALEAALRSNERLALAGRLSASIAHEIHNPLDTVGNALFLISQRINGKSDIRQLVATAQGEVQRVVEISKNMLSLHRESRAPSAVNLSELLRGVVTLIEETIAKTHRNIEFVPGFEGEVEAFPSELRQVFTNVIKNAVEATAEGGEIKIYSEAAREADREGVLVRVVDTGVGIPEDLQSRLFTPFVTTKEESGTGLGLWVSRSIMEKHGGGIRIDAGVNGRNPGTTVSIFLPLKIGARKGASLKRAAGARTGSAD